jgi:hypothetical protein
MTIFEVHFELWSYTVENVPGICGPEVYASVWTATLRNALYPTLS